MVQKYINIQHEYGSFDCIELIKQFYANELSLDFSIPSYPKSREWMKHFTSKSVDDWASVYGEKVKLTEAKNYDVMSFKSLKSDLIVHFGLYIQHNQILHVEEGGYSSVELLSDYWRQRLHSIYRHNDMV